ncbi:MAG: beta-ketoacyl synthase N-terminal-like domain-containing protein [bacterium]
MLDIGCFCLFYFSLSIPCACAAGNYSIRYASDLLKMSRTNVMLAEGADPLSRISFTGFNRLLAMAPKKCTPFDKNRKGIFKVTIALNNGFAFGRNNACLVLKKY